MENLIKDLLYEHSARRYLANRRKKPAIWKKFIPLSIAASIILGLGIYFNSQEDQYSIYQELYTFPTVLNTRGADLSSEQKSNIEQKEYQKALDLFTSNELVSDRDFYMLANLYIINNEFIQADALLHSPEWPSSYDPEKSWLLFLLESRRIEPNIDLMENLISQMNKEDQRKAKLALENKY